MDLDVFFENYFKKTEHEKDLMLCKLSSDYISACKEIDMDILEILIHLNDLIKGYEKQEKYEQADAFHNIKTTIEKVIIDDLTNGM